VDQMHRPQGLGEPCAALSTRHVCLPACLPARQRLIDSVSHVHPLPLPTHRLEWVCTHGRQSSRCAHRVRVALFPADRQCLTPWPYAYFGCLTHVFLRVLLRKDTCAAHCSWAGQT
jgi:hypothetical protein